MPSETSKTGSDRKRRMPNHFSAGMMWRLNESRIEFLVIEYREGEHGSTWKFPGGTNRKSRKPLAFRDESPVHTLAREWKGEVGQTLGSAGNNPVTFQIKGHTQFFFLLDEDDVEEGDIRKEVMVEKENGRPDETLGIPQWMPAEELRELMSGRHLQALKKAEEAVNRLLKARERQQKENGSISSL